MARRDVRNSPIRIVVRCVAIAIVLGGATTVGIAWLFTRDFDQRRIPARIGERQGGNATSRILVFRYDSTGRSEIKVEINNWASGMPGPDQSILSIEETVPGWARREFAPILASEGNLDPGNYDSRSALAVGWPMLALWCPYRYEPNPTGYWILRADRAIVLRRATAATPLGRFGPRDDALPVLPLWVGFAVDTAVFACLWALALFGPGAGRRAVRRRRGRCSRCAYDIRGLPAGTSCPECGG